MQKMTQGYFYFRRRHQNRCSMVVEYEVSAERSSCPNSIYLGGRARMAVVFCGFFEPILC
jgi:hypothetical protein